MPVILGADIIAYYLARCFHEAYGVKSVVVGRERWGFTDHTRILDFRLEPDLWQRDRFVDILVRIAQDVGAGGRQLILIGANDQYVRQIVESRDALSAHYVFNYLTLEQLNSVQDKANFYELCARNGMDIPETVIYDLADDAPVPTFDSFPRIIKPSNGDTYFRAQWPGQKKVYRLNSNEEIAATIALIRRNGYRDRLVIQEFIPGDDTLIYDSVFYCNRAAKCEFVSFGQVLLQEHSVAAVGNYTALVSRVDRPYMDKLKAFVEAIGYVGIGNADIKYDARDGKFKLLEINVRQGRSSYYVVACGFNLARYLVDDLIYDRPATFDYVTKPMLHTVVPMGVIARHVADDDLRREAKQLRRQGSWVDPLRYRGDLSPRRRWFLWLHGLNYFRKYRQQSW